MNGMLLKLKGFIILFIYVGAITFFVDGAFAVSFKDYDEAVSAGAKLNLNHKLNGIHSVLN